MLCTFAARGRGTPQGGVLFARRLVCSPNRRRSGRPERHPCAASRRLRQGPAPHRAAAVGDGDQSRSKSIVADVPTVAMPLSLIKLAVAAAALLLALSAKTPSI